MMTFSTDPKSGASSPSARAPRVLILGARRKIRRVVHAIEHGPWAGAVLVGCVDASGRGRQIAVHPASAPVPVLGRIDRLAELVRDSGATDLLVALSERSAERLKPQLNALSESGRSVRVHWLSEHQTRPADPPHTRLVPQRPAPPRVHWGRIAKRAIDLLAAGGGLLVLSPLLGTVAALIWLTSGRPIFYTQERVGQGGRLFRIIKFRSMRVDAEGSTGPIWAANHDDRCTPLGDWLRQTSIDELPQLWNIVRGDMSLVGPRPERPVFVSQFLDEIPEYALRHSMPVGLTGWAQVHGWRGRTSLRKRLQYDLDYIRRWTFWLDLQILLMTVLHVALGKVDWGTEAKNRRIERELADAHGRDSHLQRPDAA